MRKFLRQGLIIVQLVFTIVCSGIDKPDVDKQICINLGRYNTNSMIDKNYNQIIVKDCFLDDFVQIVFWFCKHNV